VWARPPTRSRASSTRQERPASASRPAAPRPAAPAPTMATSTAGVTGLRPRRSGWRCRSRRGSGVEPGLACLLRALEAVDLGVLLQGQANVVEAVEQAVLLPGIDLEVQRTAVRSLDRLGLQVDGQGGVGAARGIVEQLGDLLGRQLDQQDTV